MGINCLKIDLLLSQNINNMGQEKIFRKKSYKTKKSTLITYYYHKSTNKKQKKFHLVQQER